MRSPLDALLTQKSLTFIHSQKGTDLMDAVIDSTDVVTRNVCAKVSPLLSDRIDNVCQMLDMRKRAFLEAAFIEAVEKAEQIMRSEGVYESLEEQSQ